MVCVDDRIEFDVGWVHGVVALQHIAWVTAAAMTKSVLTQVQGCDEKVIQLDDVHVAVGILGTMDSVRQVRKASLQVTLPAKRVSAAIAMNLGEQQMFGYTRMSTESDGMLA
jgi:hypothetical protein